MLRHTSSSSKSMRTTRKEPAVRSTPLHYLVGILAIALTLCSLLGLYWYTTPASASSASSGANGWSAFDDESETPGPTWTASPTRTTTSTPSPSPVATTTTTPFPTSTNPATPIATGTPSTTTTGLKTPSPGVTPTSGITSITITAQKSGLNLTPITSQTQASAQGNQPGQGTHRSGNSLPFTAIALILGSAALLGLLCIAGWIRLRKRLRPTSSSNPFHQGAVSWSRTRFNEQVFPITPLDIATGYFTPGTSYSGIMTTNPDSNPLVNLYTLADTTDVPVPNLSASSSRNLTIPAVNGMALPNTPSVCSGQSFDEWYQEASLGQRRDMNG
jgi:hypothetical protein